MINQWITSKTWLATFLRAQAITTVFKVKASGGGSRGRALGAQTPPPLIQYKQKRHKNPRKTILEDLLGIIFSEKIYTDIHITKN